MKRHAALCAVSSFVVGVVASCGGGPPPDPKLRPEGSGWYCFEQQGGTEKGCRRTAAECESNRERRLRFRGGVTFSNCFPGPSQVHCFSFYDKEFGRTDYTCTPESGQCVDQADALGEDPTLKVSMVDISGCAPWQ